MKYLFVTMLCFFAMNASAGDITVSVVNDRIEVGGEQAKDIYNQLKAGGVEEVLFPELPTPPKDGMDYGDMIETSRYAKIEHKNIYCELDYINDPIQVKTTYSYFCTIQLLK